LTWYGKTSIIAHKSMTLFEFLSQTQSYIPSPVASHMSSLGSYWSSGQQGYGCVVVYVGLAILHSTIVIQEILTIKLPSIFDEYTQQCNDENYNIPETCDIMIVTCDIMIVTCDIMIVTFALKYEVALAANMDQFLIQGKLCEIAT